MKNTRRIPLYRLAMTFFIAQLSFSGPSLLEAQEQSPLPTDLFDPNFLQEAAQEILDEAEGLRRHREPEIATKTVGPDASVLLEMSEGVPPPEASHISPVQQGIAVSGAPLRVKRSTPKPRPVTEVAPYVSNSLTSAENSEDWRQVAFASGSFTPSSGVDYRLKAAVPALRAEGRNYVYGFLLLNEFLSQYTQQELETLGVQLLGPHSNLYKAKIPLEVLDTIAQLPYVEWIGWSTVEQKLSVDLKALKDAASAPSGFSISGELPIVVNLFDHDTDGACKHQLENIGVKIGKYDPELRAYRAVASLATIEQLTAFDFVLAVELVRKMTANHDQSMATISADYISTGGNWGTRYDGSATMVGIIDTGFMMSSAAAIMHQDLNKNGCGVNFTTDLAGVWNDQTGHGTHVLGTIAGTGTANRRYRGVASGVGGLSWSVIRAAKALNRNGTGPIFWAENAMDFMDDPWACNNRSPRPRVINMSLGTAPFPFLPWPGTDSTSRKLDEKVWLYKQTYVVAAGNSGPFNGSTGSPGVAKNALTVGNVFDYGQFTVGDIHWSSSRGPTGDGRMKPNVVAPGTLITSARAGTTNGYRTISGTSMAAPHVTGLVATLMHHYPYFRWNPALLRSHVMATAIPHDDVITPVTNTSGGKNTYGLGRGSSYLAHWSQNNVNGWFHNWTSGTVNNATSMRYKDIQVPAGTRRLVVVMTWDEPSASALASRAVSYDLDLWIDHLGDCGGVQCGEYVSSSGTDNVEYVIINNPPAGLYRLKVVPYHASTFNLPFGMTAVVIRGDTTPAIKLTATPSSTSVALGSTFTVTTTVANPSYAASGVRIQRGALPNGVIQQGMQTTREDGVIVSGGGTTGLTLGDIVASRNRSAVWTFWVNTPGPKSFNFQAWSENGGVSTATVTVNAG